MLGSVQDPKRRSLSRGPETKIERIEVSIVDGSCCRRCAALSKEPSPTRGGHESAFFSAMASNVSMDPPAAIDPADLLANTPSTGTTGAGAGRSKGVHGERGSGHARSSGVVNRPRGDLHADLHGRASGGGVTEEMTPISSKLALPRHLSSGSLRSARYFQPTPGGVTAMQPAPQCRSTGPSHLRNNGSLRRAVDGGAALPSSGSWRRAVDGGAALSSSGSAVSLTSGGGQASSIGTYSVPTFKDGGDASDLLLRGSRRQNLRKAQRSTVDGGDDGRAARDGPLPSANRRMSVGKSSVFSSLNAEYRGMHDYGQNRANTGSISKGDPGLQQISPEPASRRRGNRDRRTKQDNSLLDGLSPAMAKVDGRSTITRTASSNEILAAADADPSANHSKKQLLGELLSTVAEPPSSRVMTGLSASERSARTTVHGRDPVAHQRLRPRAKMPLPRSNSSGSEAHSGVVEGTPVEIFAGNTIDTRCSATSDLSNRHVNTESMFENHTATRSKDTRMEDGIKKQLHQRGGSPHRPRLSQPLNYADAVHEIPSLPTIRTFRVVKRRPDEPAGLFLRKARNGAVLVHSLSDESLFRSPLPPTPGTDVPSLRPGQEILSVNEKRVNDPKMAAALITQSRRHLSLRVSTLERVRGLMYCQVKRRGVGGAGVSRVGVEGMVADGNGDTKGIAAAVANLPLCGVGKRGGGRGGGSSPGLSGHPGVRFSTTSVDGLRRSDKSGLVRVSHIDRRGLFAGSHPANRLRVGTIVLTVSGRAVCDGRTALERVMGSESSVVEVLHCDERVWREDWVRDALNWLSGEGTWRDPREVARALFATTRRQDDVATSDRPPDIQDEGAATHVVEQNAALNAKSSSDWDMEWTPEREEVLLRKKGSKSRREAQSSSTPYAFKLIFNNETGKCQPELVNDEIMMPPADEFDVLLLVKTVNESQRAMITMLQTMLRNRLAKESSEVDRSPFKVVGKDNGGASSPACARRRQEIVAHAGVITANAASTLQPGLPPRQQATISAVSNADGSPLNDEHQEIRPLGVSAECLAENREYNGGGVHNQGHSPAPSNGLLRADNRRRQTEERLVADFHAMHIADNKRIMLRRGSTGFSEAIVCTPPADLERWHLEHRQKGEDLHHPANNSNKLREFSARQHKMEAKEEEHNRIASSGGSHNALDGTERDSMFSTDMLEDFLDYLEDASDGRPVSHSAFPSGSSSKNEDRGDEKFGSRPSSLDSSPSSPRNDGNEKWEDGSILRIPPTNEVGSNEETSTLATDENKGNDEVAYITGVWRDVESKYKISDKIVGSGGFGEVRNCYDKKTGEIHVVKTIFKPSQDDTTKINLIRNEILLLHEAHHPNIVELRDLFEDDKYVHIVMERCTGGDLFDRVVAENPRKLRTPAAVMKHEGRTANLMRSILQVLKYLHSKGIVHRDIKPEHFLLTTDKRDTQKLKLIDFGLARKHKPGSALMTTFTGSPSFVAPEVIARRYDHLCDMFSVGVTAYFMLTGMLPFDGPTDEETFDLISNGRFEFPSSAVFLSNDAKDFIRKLLRIDPSKRMSASNALNHPWLRRQQSSC